jgi:hypothetical protein
LVIEAKVLLSASEEAVEELYFFTLLSKLLRNCINQFASLYLSCNMITLFASAVVSESFAPSASLSKYAFISMYQSVAIMLAMEEICLLYISDALA